MDRLPSESLNLQTKSRLAVSSHSDAVKSTQEELTVAASRIRHLTGRFGLTQRAQEGLAVAASRIRHLTRRFGLTQRAEDKLLSLPAEPAI